ncbi:hypothetical protein ES332_D11G064400v1 [Gossypium tomentosum]|uniref:Uncharacterized protein n=1 Tax=Gossypium tomentosum TaxID=34277 RepID=A0A5D2IJK5_GOSTO|nr:hypothetical protein ES332_D11G064400v1 [Gossypium tomentosum]
MQVKKIIREEKDSDEVEKEMEEKHKRRHYCQKRTDLSYQKPMHVVGKPIELNQNPKSIGEEVS